MAFQRIPNGDYYHFSRNSWSTEMIVKSGPNDESNGGMLSISGACPKELIGKKVRVKLEIVKGKVKHAQKV